MLWRFTPSGSKIIHARRLYCPIFCGLLFRSNFSIIIIIDNPAIRLLDWCRKYDSGTPYENLPEMVSAAILTPSASWIPIDRSDCPQEGPLCYALLLQLIMGSGFI